MSERPAAEPGQGDAPAPAVRRRLQAANPQDTKGRGGCLVTGAILGIIFGLTFAFYGLPPILRHYYGEEKIEAGQAYVDGERRLQVTSNRVAPDSAEGGTGLPVMLITVTSEGFAENEPRPGRFRLEVDGVESWVSPLPQLPVSEPPDPVAAETVLRFAIPDGLDARAVNPVALHLEDPRVRFALAAPVYE